MKIEVWWDEDPTLHPESSCWEQGIVVKRVTRGVYVVEYEFCLPRAG